MKTKYFYMLLFFIGSFTIEAYGQLIRCSTPELESQLVLKDSTYVKRRSQQEINLQNFIQSEIFTYYKRTQRSGESVIVIPIVVHLIGNNVISQVNSAKIIQQIQILNNDFRKISGTSGFGNGADTEIEFCLASRDPFGNATNGIVQIPGSYPVYDNTANDNTALKSLSHWPPISYLNIWVCNVPPSKLAWGTFPSMFLGTLDEFQDGVVCGVNYFGVTADPKYGKGRTLTHEVGHWLNLRHTWGDANNCSGTDFVGDTPFCMGQNFSAYSNGCLPHPQQCATENNVVGLTTVRQIENYMDYSDDLCMNMFTDGQRQRMIATLNTNRAFLFLSDGCLNNTNSGGTQTGGGSGFGNSIFDGGACETVQFSINGKSTMTNQVINVCQSDINLAPFSYDDNSCAGSANWLFRVSQSNILCSQTANMWQAGSKEYNGVFNNKCQCYWLRLFISVQECDKNRTLIGNESNQWFYIFDSDQSILSELTLFRSFNLNNYLPQGVQIQEGKYYKIKVASYDQGSDATTAWVEHNGYIRVYKDDLFIQNSNINHDQFANTITIDNSIVAPYAGIKVVAKNRIIINPKTTLMSGAYFIKSFDCTTLDQFSK